MSTTNRISVVLAKLGLLIIVALLLGGTLFDLYPDPCNDIEELADREEVVEQLRLDLTDFVNSREGRTALLEMSGLTRRRERLPRTFDAVISNLDIYRSKTLLVREFDRTSRRSSGLDATEAIGIGYSRARLLYPIANRDEASGQLDPIELSKDLYVVCIND